MTDELDDFLPVELEGFGETIGEMLCGRLNPVYFKASISESVNWLDSDEEDSEEKMEAALRGLNEALVKERTRLGGKIKEPRRNARMFATRRCQLASTPRDRLIFSGQTEEKHK
jgi:hypothetical protein